MGARLARTVVVSLFIAFVAQGCGERATQTVPTATAEPAQNGAMADSPFARAEALLAKSARRWTPTASQGPGPLGWWGPDVVGFREYLSDSESTTVRIYRFSSDQSAASNGQEMLRALQATPIDGVRTKVLRNGEFVFWIQGSVVPPNHPRAAEAHATFDAVIVALTPP